MCTTKTHRCRVLRSPAYRPYVHTSTDSQENRTLVDWTRYNLSRGKFVINSCIHLEAHRPRCISPVDPVDHPRYMRSIKQLQCLMNRANDYYCGFLHAPPSQYFLKLHMDHLIRSIARDLSIRYILHCTSPMGAWFLKLFMKEGTYMLICTVE